MLSRIDKTLLLFFLASSQLTNALEFEDAPLVYPRHYGKHHFIRQFNANASTTISSPSTQTTFATDQSSFLAEILATSKTNAVSSSIQSANPPSEEQEQVSSSSGSSILFTPTPSSPVIESESASISSVSILVNTDERM